MNKKRIEDEMEVKNEDTYDSEEVNERYTYFATLQSWLKDYTHFINSKYASIEEYIK